ncbi:MAG: HlyD family efflux transporter periplasmic adaptor subunit, partial [Syntrophomonadaceae bacterium]|nr:HlyD family efflux transporter periplasmic adaptor subunit [Syntrophomonadaceae bacterium]
KSVGVTEGSELTLDALIATVSNDDILELQVPLNLAIADMLSRGQTTTMYVKDYHVTLDATVSVIDGRTTARDEGGVVKMVTLLVKNPGALKVGDEARLQFEHDGTHYTSIGYSKFKEQEPLLIEAKSIGPIEEIHIKEGDVIVPGSPILTLDKADQAIALQTAQIELEQGIIDMALKEKNYAKYFGTAGIDGIVSEINIEEGKAPPVGKAAVIISGHGPLKMRLEVDEADIGMVQLGQSADVYAGSFGNQSFPGTVSRVAARGKVDNNDVYFEVDITINDPGALKPGMTGDADIYTDKKSDVLRLPVNAVSIIDDGLGMVQVVIPAAPEGDESADPALSEDMYGAETGLSKREAKKLAKEMEKQGIDPNFSPTVTESREIVIGIEGDDYIEIISGLEEGDEVIVSGGMGYGDMGYGGVMIYGAKG